MSCRIKDMTGRTRSVAAETRPAPGGVHADVVKVAAKERRRCGAAFTVVVVGADFESGFLTGRGRFVTIAEAASLPRKAY